MFFGIKRRLGAWSAPDLLVFITGIEEQQKNQGLERVFGRGYPKTYGLYALECEIPNKKESNKENSKNLPIWRQRLPLQARTKKKKNKSGGQAL